MARAIAQRRNLHLVFPIFHSISLRFAIALLMILLAKRFIHRSERGLSSELSLNIITGGAEGLSSLEFGSCPSLIIARPFNSMAVNKY